MARPDALQRRYIEANPKTVSNLLVVDIDHSDAFLRAVSHRLGWLPNAVVEKRSTGRSHAVWALADWITRTEYARRKPLAYAAAVAEGLRRSVDGDTGYSGLMQKPAARGVGRALAHRSPLHAARTRRAPVQAGLHATQKLAARSARQSGRAGA